MKTILAMLVFSLSTQLLASERECTIAVAKNTQTITSTSTYNFIPTKSYVWGIDNQAESYLNEKGFELASDFNKADVKVFLQFDSSKTPITEDVSYVHDKVLTMTVYKADQIVLRRSLSGFLTDNSYKKLLKQIDKNELKCE